MGSINQKGRFRRRLLRAYNASRNERTLQENRCAVPCDAESCPLMRLPRLLIRSFVSGLARGLGMAIGFTLLGALVLYILKRLAVQNLPIIGAFIREILEIAEANAVK